jgi:hypothetical protein
MGLMNCTDCGAKHSDANGTICPNCGRKHKVGFFDLSDEEKQQQEIEILITQELDYVTDNFNDLRHKWRDNPYALEYIDKLDKMREGKMSPKQFGIMIMIVVVVIFISIAYSVISVFWDAFSKTF